MARSSRTFPPSSAGFISQAVLCRDRAYSVFYVGINLGAFLAPLVSGTLADTFGWHYGFAAAGVGMAVGLAIYLYAMPTLPRDEPHKTKAAGLNEKPLNRDELRAAPGRISLAMRTISSSTSLSTWGLPGVRRAREPSNLRATSLRYHAKLVSGRAAVASRAPGLSCRARVLTSVYSETSSKASRRLGDANAALRLFRFAHGARSGRQLQHRRVLVFV